MQSGTLNDLGSALQTRYNRPGDRADLEWCITYYHEALAFCPVSHSLRSSILNGLAKALLTRYKIQGYAADLKCCLLHLKEASTGYPVSVPRLNDHIEIF